MMNTLDLQAAVEAYFVAFDGAFASFLPCDDALCALERQRTQALVARDMPTLERLHASAYQLITPTGKVFSRERYLGTVAAQPFYAAWDVRSAIAVRRSPGMALLRYQARISFPSGRVVDCWHTDSYEAFGGQWQAVWSQATACTP